MFRQMMVEYVEFNEPISTKYPTWIIGYCPDTDSFFATNQRHFFWETEKDFASEKEAIKHFESNIGYFLDIKNMIMKFILYNYVPEEYVVLENTNKEYFVKGSKIDD